MKIRMMMMRANKPIPVIENMAGLVMAEADTLDCAYPARPSDVATRSAEFYDLSCAKPITALEQAPNHFIDQIKKGV
jgi:hypothetical protein